jgi:superfamily II DNA/RNA helicase
MVLAPPNLLDRKNPGSWTNVFADFNIPAQFFSTNKLDEAIKETSQRKYDNIVIDEAHRFRNESTISYTKVAQICVGKRVILVTATPYNNSPKDLLNQIRLFQKSRKSTIPGITDLDSFFTKLQQKLDQVDRTGNYEEYLKVVKENAKEIRDKCLKYIMIRRTRNEIQKYFSKDLEKNKLRFPEILPPTPLIYQLDAKLDKIFMDTVKLISKNLKYARYMPLLYLKNRESRINQLDEQSQKNLSGFMKVLLVKRLESSFYAFKKTLERFIQSYELFIGAYEKGKVYFSKKHFQQIFDLLSQNSFEEIQQLVDEGKAEEYNSDEFEENLIFDLKKDYELLQQIRDWWSSIDYDPKIEKLKEQLNKDSILRNNKLVIFTEAKETAEYLYEQLTQHLNKEPLLFTGDSSNKIRDLVIDNFDARAREPKDDYRILISTEVLSEGVNLHRANVVINYDIPWNPTRLMQRVGRVNRVDTKFDKIYTYNFFPSEQSEDEIELIKIARSKIEAFLNLLGGDSAILTEGEPVSSHELFDKLISVSTLTGEDELEESELKYLRVIEDVRDNNPELFDYIKRLPKKARSSKSYKDLLYEFENYNIQKNSLLTFFRMNKLNKFYLANQYGIIEVDFLTAAKILESKENQSHGKIDLEKFYELLAKNKNQFTESLEEEHSKPRRGGYDASKEFLKFLKYLESRRGLTEKQEEYIKILMQRINEGVIPKKLISDTLKKIKKLDKEQTNPHNIFILIKNEIPEVFLTTQFTQTFNEYMGKKEIILSLYLSEE